MHSFYITHTPPFKGLLNNEVYDLVGFRFRASRLGWCFLDDSTARRGIMV